MHALLLDFSQMCENLMVFCQKIFSYFEMFRPSLSSWNGINTHTLDNNFEIFKHF